MDGQKFEKIVRDKMRDFGWLAHQTKGSYDLGVDVICELDKEKIVIQCKKYAAKNHVGISAVQEVHAARAYHQADAALIVYTGKVSRFTADFARKLDVEIFHINDLVDGFKFDRTEEGRRFRKQQEELKKKEERARNEALRQQQIESFRTLYRIYQSDLASWEAKTRQYKFWLVIMFASLAIVPAAVSMIAPVQIAVLAEIAFLFFVFATRKPGTKPIAPVYTGSGNPFDNDTASSATRSSEVPKSPSPVGKLQSDTKIIRCSQCKKQNRYPVIKSRTIARCGSCKAKLFCP